MPQNSCTLTDEQKQNHFSMC